MGDSVRERILNNIETELKKISRANGYHEDIKSVQRWSQRGNSLLDVPAIIINAGPDDWENSPNPLVTANLTVYLDLWIRQPNDDKNPTDKLLNDILMDIYEALMADNTRGGIAHDTTIKSITPFETIEGEPHAGLIIEVLIHYRFYQNDPETAG